MPDFETDYTDEAEFSAGQAARVSGLNPILQRHYRQRGLLPEREGASHARFKIADVMRMTIMAAFSDSKISTKATAAFSLKASVVATAKLLAMDGAVDIDAETPEAEAYERERLQSYARMFKTRYIFLPLPQSDDAPGTNEGWERETLADLADLVGQDGSFHGVLIDLNALAALVYSRVTLPLQTHVVTLRRTDGGAE